jgi:hypothetical protein
MLKDHNRQRHVLNCLNSFEEYLNGDYPTTRLYSTWLCEVRSFVKHLQIELTVFLAEQPETDCDLYVKADDALSTLLAYLNK